MKLKLFNFARKDTGLSHYYERNDTANQLFLPVDRGKGHGHSLYKGWEEDERYFAPLGAGSLRLKSSSLPLYKEDITELCQFLYTKKRQDLPRRLSQQNKEAELNQQPAGLISMNLSAMPRQADTLRATTPKYSLP